MKQYKFVLGLENIVQVDYITEKFYQLFATGCAALQGITQPHLLSISPEDSFVLRCICPRIYLI
jgi:hypothetical protein